jgi:hypothetical protein
MGEKWIDFVKRIHTEGSKKDKDYSFKNAMVDAGKRKSEWKKDGTKSSKKGGGQPLGYSTFQSKGGARRKRKSGTKKRRKTARK